MKLTYSFVFAFCACAAVVQLASAHPAAAQALSSPSTATDLETWDTSALISITGSIQSIATQHATGAPAGFNILVSSTQGVLYANLGPHPGAQFTDKLTNGQFVTLTGTIHTYNGNKYVLVRTFNLNGQTFAVRNAHGFTKKNIATPQSASIHQGSFGGAR